MIAAAREPRKVDGSPGHVARELPPITQQRRCSRPRFPLCFSGLPPKSAKPPRSFIGDHDMTLPEQCMRETSSPIRVLVASSCPAMLEGLALILERRSTIQVLARERDASGALRGAVTLKPDVTVLDWQLSGSHAAILVHAIRTYEHEARMVILSELHSDQDIVPGLRSGAVGYIDRNSSAEAILTCVARVHAGHRHLAPLATMRLASSVHFDGLTSRERELIELLGKNRTNREIATALKLSPSTVRSHLAGLLVKLNARNRTEAIEVAIECGLMAPAVELGRASGSTSASIN